MRTARLYGGPLDGETREVQLGKNGRMPALLEITDEWERHTYQLDPTSGRRYNHAESLARSWPNHCRKGPKPHHVRLRENTARTCLQCGLKLPKRGERVP